MGVFGGVLGFTRRGKRKGNVSQTHKPAKWRDFPDYKKFWDSFVDMFWGKNGGNSFQNMLTQDTAYLKNLYLKNNAAMDKIERQFGQGVDSTSNNYANDLKNNTVDVRTGGRHLFSFVPNSTLRTENAKKKNALDDLSAQLGIGSEKLKRALATGLAFTPNKTNMAYLNMLAQLGREGQGYRMSLSTTQEKGKVPQLGTMAGLGNALNLTSKGYSLWNDMGKPGKGLFSTTPDTTSGAELGAGTAGATELGSTTGAGASEAGAANYGAGWGASAAGAWL